MVDYTSREITQLQKQYDMLIKSIKFTKEETEKSNIYYQLNKLIIKIIDVTSIIYNDVYREIENKKTSLLKEEKEKLVDLINLIENRKSYIEDMLNKHNFYVPSQNISVNILGQDKMLEFQKRIRVIDKYRQNVRLKEKLMKEIESIDDNIAKSENKIKSNEKINIELENKMIEMFEKSFKALEIYSYKDRVDEIELAYTELLYAKNKAEQNVEAAKIANNTTLIIECEKMLESLMDEYDKYYEKKMLLQLLDIYDKKVKDYSQLLSKREKINEILSQIDNSDFYKLVIGEITKQFTTIKLEQHDVKNYDNLKNEKETKKKLLDDLENENNSSEFKDVLNELLKNEKIKQEQEMIEKRKKEYEERQQKLIEDSKKQEEIRKRQKTIEEARKRDIELRTKELLEEKQKSLNTFTKKESQQINKDVEQRDKFVDKILKEMDNKKEEKAFFDTNVNNNPPIEDKKEATVTKENKYDEIFATPFIQNKEEDTTSIPIIKNDKFVSKKLNQKEIDENQARMEMNDIVFPDMPI